MSRVLHTFVNILLSIRITLARNVCPEDFGALFEFLRLVFIHKRQSSTQSQKYTFQFAMLSFQIIHKYIQLHIHTFIYIHSYR